MSEYTSEGALYELMARGNKDIYFQSDTLTSLSPFRNNYKRVPSYIHELRKIPPINNTDFGKTIEFDFEVAGDVFTHPTLLIDLPSWLPPEYAANNNNSKIRDSNGISYGYTNGIGYFLFSNIQVYQDQILVQEFSGDALYATRLSQNSLNTGVLHNQLIGYHDTTDTSIARNATPKTLRVELPLIGCQHKDDGGFPSFAIRSQNFRLRCILRKLEDLVESSDSQQKPTPWDKGFSYQSISSVNSILTAPYKTFNSTISYFSSLQRYNIGQPSIYLETRHIYVDSDTQKELVDSELEYPYSRLYENIYHINDRDYAPLNNGASAFITRRIDAVHPASKMVFFLRQKDDIDANKLWKITSSTSNSEYYNNFSFLIASRDRESSFAPFVWNVISQHAKEDRYGGSGLGNVNWDLGEQRGRKLPYARQPEGSVNFSTADRPSLFMELQNISSITQRNTEMRLIVDTWSIYETEDRRGSLKYAN